ncbi:MAG: DUF3168 domain-containing protein [Candidatus Altiarchaeales archaeon]|nr:DUF3168 domain-containing protein [Candidatus Altiarchaeales archaeon]
MRKLLLRIQDVLTGDKHLTEVLPSDNIGSSVRQNAKWPCLEYGVSDVPRQHPSGKLVTAISIRIYSTTGPSECWQIAERLRPIMIPKVLTDKDLRFKVDKVRLTDTIAETDLFTDWRYRVEVEYTIWLTELDTIPQT